MHFLKYIKLKKFIIFYSSFKKFIKLSLDLNIKYFDKTQKDNNEIMPRQVESKSISFSN